MQWEVRQARTAAAADWGSLACRADAPVALLSACRCLPLPSSKRLVVSAIRRAWPASTRFRCLRAAPACTSFQVRPPACTHTVHSSCMPLGTAGCSRALLGCHSPSTLPPCAASLPCRHPCDRARQPDRPWLHAAPGAGAVGCTRGLRCCCCCCCAGGRAPQGAPATLPPLPSSLPHLLASSCSLPGPAARIRPALRPVPRLAAPRPLPPAGHSRGGRGGRRRRRAGKGGGSQQVCARVSTLAPAACFILPVGAGRLTATAPWPLTPCPSAVRGRSLPPASQLQRVSTDCLAGLWIRRAGMPARPPARCTSFAALKPTIAHLPLRQLHLAGG